MKSFMLVINLVAGVVLCAMGSLKGDLLLISVGVLNLNVAYWLSETSKA